MKWDKKELLRAMIDSKSYLFETDITRDYVQEEETNPLLRLNTLISSVAEFAEIPRSKLIEQQQKNFNSYE